MRGDDDTLFCGAARWNTKSTEVGALGSNSAFAQTGLCDTILALSRPQLVSLLVKKG